MKSKDIKVGTKYAINSPRARQKKLAEGYIKRIHVNQQEMRKNVKDGGNRPVVIVQTSEGSLTAHEVNIHGSSKLISSKPQLSCGARVWIETTARVTLTIRSGG